MSILARWKQTLSPEPIEERTLLFDAQGFEIYIKQQAVVRLPWSSVLEVSAFKHDLFAYDEICLGFRYDDSHEVWAGEQDIGFEAFRVHVERTFPGIKTEWLREVAIPAFKENRTTLWIRPRTEN